MKFSGEKIATHKSSWNDGVKNPKIEFSPVKQSGESSFGEIIEIDRNICLKFPDFEKQIDVIDEKTETNESPEIYQITNNGKIKNTETNQLSSRENFDPFLVPSKIIETENSVYVLMKSTSNHFPENWIYTFQRIWF
ncbi:MAG: hypothetical protein R2883_01315 [Caldisericia bacterium]